MLKKSEIKSIFKKMGLASQDDRRLFTDMSLCRNKINTSQNKLATGASTNTFAKENTENAELE